MKLIYYIEITEFLIQQYFANKKSTMVSHQNRRANILKSEQKVYKWGKTMKSSMLQMQTPSHLQRAFKDMPVSVLVDHNHLWTK